MKKRSEAIDIAVVLSGMSVFPLLIMSASNPQMIMYGIVMAFITYSLMRISQSSHKKHKRDYLKRIIRERKH